MKLYIVISSTGDLLGYIGTNPNYADTLRPPHDGYLGAHWITYSVQAEPEERIPNE